MLMLQQGWCRVDTFRRITVVSLAVLAFLPVRASGQGLTGTLMGTVKDGTGGVIAAATIRLASSALIGGERRTTSSDRGQWRFPALPPGTYELTVEAVPRFGAHREAAISVGGGETVERIVVLAVAGIAESLTVRTNSDLNPRTS